MDDLRRLTTHSEFMLIGDKARFAVEIGEFWGGLKEYRRVDLWAADRWLTCDDHHAHVGAFVNRIRWSLGRLRPGSGADLAMPGGEGRPEQMHRRLRRMPSLTPWQLLSWGPTTDNVLAYFFRVEERLVITFEFWREEHKRADERSVIFVAGLPEAEFVNILEQTVQLLTDGGTER